MEWFTDEFAEYIFYQKYAGQHPTIQSFFRSLAKIVSRGDLSSEAKFYMLLTQKKFSPGGRILAYAGRPDAHVSLMNCTTHAIEGDTLEDISATAYTVMRASSRGQGIGIDLSALRPADSPVNNAARSSTGAISFMEMLNAVGGTIGQEGRRAAMLFSIRDTHPDLWRPGNGSVICQQCNGEGCPNCDNGYLPYDFIHVKRIPGKVENANISVMVSDKFMQAVEEDLGWELHFEGNSGGKAFYVHKSVPARRLFYTLANAAHTSAEPGLLYWDTSKRMSNSDLFGDEWSLVGCNACSEMLLDQDGVCNLGSMNLGAYVMNPFTKEAFFDNRSFMEDVSTAVEFLDNILDIELERHGSISKKQRESIVALRRIGLGVMGLADALAMMGAEYGSPESVNIEKTIFHSMRDSAYEASIRLAKERGPAGVWEQPEDYIASILSKGFFATLPDYIIKSIKLNKIRNTTLLSIAPTGTISNLLGASSGIEPLFAHSFVRRTRMSGADELIDYVHPGVRASRKLGIPDSLWPTSYQVTPNQHILMQSTAQYYVDQSISKTLNMPSTATKEDVADAYFRGWQVGLKGMAVYRDGSRDIQVLYSNDTVEIEEEESGEKCPACGNVIIYKDGCRECSVCEWAACSI